MSSFLEDVRRKMQAITKPRTKENLKNKGETVMKKLIILLVAVALLGLAGGLMAADTDTDNHTVNVVVSGFNVIDVNGSAITLTIVAPTNAGDASTPVTDATTYLQYSSIRATSGGKVTGAISAGTMPFGISLAVTAATPGTGGAGTKGSTNNKQTLSGTSADLITGIGSCYTQRGGGNNGSNLTYELSVSNWATVVPASSTAITVTYTLL
jgi:ABC-type Na+ efflux pump permease subunit